MDCFGVQQPSFAPPDSMILDHPGTPLVVHGDVDDTFATKIQNENKKLGSQDFLLLLTIIDYLCIPTHISDISLCTMGISARHFLKHLYPILSCFTLGNPCTLVCTLATWNSHGLLGSNALTCDRQMRNKDSGIRKLLTSNHMVCIQEDHADHLESLAFARRWSQSHLIFAHNGIERNCGGVCIAIPRSFIHDCVVAFMITIVPGRICAVVIVWHHLILMLVSIHNCPSWSYAERIAHFRLLASCIPCCDSVATFIAGDLNFGLDCLRVRDGTADSRIAPVHKNLAELWERHFPGFTELAQDDATFMRADYSSNLDHIFTNIYTPILNDLAPTCSTAWSFGDLLGEASDHVPLKASIGHDSGSRVASVPTWVPSHPHFAQHCSSLLLEVRIRSGHPFEVLERHKSIIAEASKRTLRSAHLCTDGMSIDQQIYWCMVVIRARHDTSAPNCLAAFRSYPYISKFLDSSRTLDLAGICAFVSTLQHNRGLRCITDGPREEEDKARYKERMDKLGKYLSLWAAKRRKIYSLAIQREDGTVTSSTEESADVLGCFWEKQFVEPKVSIALAQAALRNFILPCPLGIQVTSSFEQFEERIGALVDSGVGVDTFVYSCWKHCHQSSRHALYNVYLFLLEHDSENTDFLLSRIVFIQKGKESGDTSGLCVRAPKKTRPLNLANTDCKIVSCMVSIVLSVICSACISSCQFGGMKGLQMIDHIFSMEAKIVEYVVCNLPHSGIVACDIAAAFPSLSRRYLLWVLLVMKLPRKLYRIIKNLHKPSFAFVCVRNRLFRKILISSGVKQGDPSAMQLFILAYDPIIRFISFSLSPVEHCLFAYCDDLAIACLNICAAWGIIIKCFDIVFKISALALNADKTQFLATSSITALEDQEFISKLDSKVSPSQFGAVIKYLGIFLGHDALKCNWNAVSLDYITIARFIGTLDCGLVTKVSLYNMLAISKLSYVAAFLPPNREILQIEKRALQLLLRGPWNSIPDGVVKNLKALGLPVQARDLATLSSSSRVRVASSTSSVAIPLHARCEDLLNKSLDVYLRHLDKHFFHQSCLHFVVFQHERFVQEFPQFRGEKISQKGAYSLLVERLPKYNFEALIHKRLLRHFPLGIPAGKISATLDIYKASHNIIGFAPSMSHFRAICNHWCTHSRFGDKTHPCCFRCGVQSDRVSHVIACSRFLEMFFGICGIIHPALSFEDIILLDGPWIAASKHRALFILLATHICFLSFHACRHGAHFCSRLVLHKLHSYTRTHIKAASFLRHLMYNVWRNALR